MSSKEKKVVPLRPLVVDRHGKLVCDLYGGTAEQLRWLQQVPGLCNEEISALDEALSGVTNGYDRLVLAVAHPGADGRVWHSQELLRDLWRADRGLGPYPLLDLLATFQTEHAYYPAYRDHLVHQLRVWLLGLYLLRRLPVLLDAVVGEVANEPDWHGKDPTAVRAEVLRRWRLTACWHDLGYVFEVQSAPDSKGCMNRTFDALNTTFVTPMAELGVITEEREKGWQQEQSDTAPLPYWPKPDTFDLLASGKYRALWQELAPAGWMSGLADKKETSGGLQPYLDLCRVGDFEADERPAFIDHGIAGALLLLRLYRFVAAYSGRLAEAMADDTDHPAVAEVAARTEQAYGTVMAAARAIAVHNVVPGLPDRRAASARGLKLPRFQLRLSGTDDRPASPLAYLLSLADGLQCWDRPRFTAPRAPDDIGLVDRQVTLTADEHRVWLRFEQDEPKAGEHFATVRQELAERMAGIDTLVACGIAEEPAPPLDSETGQTKVLDPGEYDLSLYLKAILEECGTIELHGIMPRGKARGAIRVPIEEIYAPLRVEGGADNLWQLLVDPSRHHEHLMGEARTGSQRVLLLVGAPGSGKSTFLRMTAAVLAHALSGEQWAREHNAALAFTDAGLALPVPVLIRLSELTRFMTAEEREKDLAVDAPTLIRDYLAHWAEAHRTGIPAGVVEAWLQDGSAVLLLDGLDEIPNRQLRERMSKIISKAVAAGVYGKCRFCLTSRPLRDETYQSALLPRTIDGLGDEAIERFLHRWASYVTSGDTEGHNAYTADLLAQARRASPAIRDMLRNPLMLTCLAVIHWNERRLPEQRAELLDAIVTWLLRAREHDGLGEHQRRRIFQTLARAMHCRKEGRVRELALPEAAHAVASHFPRDNDEQRQLAAQAFLEAGLVTSGIITPRGEDYLQFWHLSFQELLVADLLADSTEEQWPELLTIRRLADPEWREVVLLLAGQLRDSRRTQALLRLILAPAQDGTLADKARAYGLAMAVVNDLRPYEFVPDESLGLEQLGREVMRIFEPEGIEVPIKVRVEAAEALGQAGDPRLSQPSWVEVRPGLEFGKYPVTVQEYQRFVDAGGYDESRFGATWVPAWQESVEQLLQTKPYKDWKRLHEERDRRLPGSWARQQETPNRPIVEISWHEAKAYCRWLTDNDPGQVWTVLLPSEEEWRHAAQGPTGSRRYPWGNEDPGKGDNARANHDKTNIRHPSPVGLFPNGAASWDTAGKIHDMAGNVWEWCNDALSEDGHSESGGLFRPLRGGSYWHVSGGLEVSCRHWDRAARWADRIGFRVVRCRCCPPDPDP